MKRKTCEFRLESFQFDSSVHCSSIHFQLVIFVENCRFFNWRTLTAMCLYKKKPEDRQVQGSKQPSSKPPSGRGDRSHSRGRSHSRRRHSHHSKSPRRNNSRSRHRRSRHRRNSHDGHKKKREKKSRLLRGSIPHSGQPAPPIQHQPDRYESAMVFQLHKKPYINAKVELPAAAVDNQSSRPPAQAPAQPPANVQAQSRGVAEKSTSSNQSGDKSVPKTEPKPTPKRASLLPQAAPDQQQQVTIVRQPAFDEIQEDK
ncbi:hypothetical protein M3Y95_00422800 [Aphelenchoides besseyi]|nr:hypothetical protein M3Y95_00422800 [Aphelenchoides besseyi]